jgi:hypothetical protein
VLRGTRILRVALPKKLQIEHEDSICLVDILGKALARKLAGVPLDF